MESPHRLPLAPLHHAVGRIAHCLREMKSYLEISMHRGQFFSLIAAGAVLGNPGINARQGFAASLENSAICPDASRIGLRTLETAAQGRLGVYILDASSGKGIHTRISRKIRGRHRSLNRHG
jgi:hypothetical protein